VAASGATAAFFTELHPAMAQQHSIAIVNRNKFENSERYDLLDIDHRSIELEISHYCLHAGT
jgi:hypothetical protein